ncbi:hypothetical protein UMNF18_3241 [Escherichia coli UMNF18]|nr:hypothetical protein UMNF18_3241 [Escherichia coli UMNF18]EII47111.1 hypothetical protein EC23916_3221 [Escherichia coli 2.3916]
MPIVTHLSHINHIAYDKGLSKQIICLDYLFYTLSHKPNKLN